MNYQDLINLIFIKCYIFFLLLELTLLNPPGQPEQNARSQGGGRVRGALRFARFDSQVTAL